MLVFAACHDAAGSHPPHPLPPVPDAFRQADRLHVQRTMPAAGKRKSKYLCRVFFCSFWKIAAHVTRAAE